MTQKKGPLERIADAVGDAVQSVAAGVGLASESEPEPQSKSDRKAARKAVVARAEEARKVTRRSRR